MGATSEAGTAFPPQHLSSPLIFSGVRVTRVLVLCVCFVDRCLSFCIFFCLAIVLSVCLRFFDLRILGTPLLSSNSSHHDIACWPLNSYMEVYI